MKYRNILAVVAFTILMVASSCSSTKNISYMQNARYGQEETVTNLNQIRIQPGDKISIVVSCKEPELARLFNLVQTTNRVGNTESTQQSDGRVSVYTVDSSGDIEFPVLGRVHVAGLTREQVSEKIARRLIDDKWISDPVVTVEYTNMHFSVLGEVNSPGTYPMTNDRLTLLEALSMAGDLTPYGEREITVVREQGGKRTKYRIDLRDEELFESPAYYLQQNDVIYVQPNKVIARQSADNPNNVKSVGLWTSIASLLTTIAVLVFK